MTMREFFGGQVGRQRRTLGHARMQPASGHRGAVRLRSRLWSLLIVIGLLSFSGVASAEQAPDESARVGTEFQAADLSKHKEDLSGIPFMVGAYMIIWAGLFWYMNSVRKRNARLAVELQELRAAVKAHDEQSIQ